MKDTTAFFSIESLSPLYEAVQSSGIFPDSKYFPDCAPLMETEALLELYKTAKEQPGFDLKGFVEQHFGSPKAPKTDYQTGDKTMAEHLNGLWDVLTRQPDEADGTLIPLPHPYIVPGGRFREIYYWDSYFTMLGLQTSGRIDLMENMVNNFAYLIDTVGFIPNGNRTYYLGRSQPPFFSLMVGLLAEAKGQAVLLQFRPQLEKEYRFWMDGALTLTAEQPTHRRVVRMADGTILNRYWDDHPAPRPEAYTEDVHIADASALTAEETYRHIRAAAESGWDFSSRWFSDHENMATIQTTDLIPVDLNCLLYHLEKTLLEIYRQLPDRVAADVMKEKARARKNAIQKYCWCEGSSFYADYHFKNKKPIGKNPTLAMVFPLYFNIATTDQAVRVAELIESEFLHPGGVVTTLNRSGQQWDAPNGWAPLQWMTYKGLRNYTLHKLADHVKTNWLAVCEKTFAETGKMMEKYNVMDADQTAGGGEYPNQDGFGWTNGVYLKLKMG